ncbi:hypothetical protein FO519_005947 [Halicephalobus sp. NKZ332]|nr:hypothetical protein FO519_005947 [Halicephalobus sp. NKZ332]
MSSIDRAREEVERIARDMKQSAQDSKFSFKNATDNLRNLTTKPTDQTFGKTIGQLRIALLVALAFQAMTLFMEADRIGLLGFLVPFALIAGNIFLSGKRWYYQIDGRYDAQQLTQVSDPSLKAQYGLALFGGVLLSLLAHTFTPVIPSSMASVIYYLGDYASIATSFVVAGWEVFEGLKNKLR